MQVPILPTFADGLAVGKVGDMAFPLAAPLVDRVVTVSEEEIPLAGASIQEIRHDRAFSGPDVFSTTVEVTVETADRAHIADLFERLASAGFRVVGNMPAAEKGRPSSQGSLPA